MLRVTQRIRLSIALATAAALLAPGAASAQSGFGADEVDQSPQLKRAGSIVKRWVQRPTGNPEDVKLFEDYFDRYYFPSMTQNSTEGLGDLGKLRADLFRQYLDPAAPEIRQQLTQKAYTFANRVIRRRAPDGTNRRYHRAVEYNAVLILGGLTSDGTKPLAPANRFLTQIVGLAAQQRLPEYMLAGALVGLGGHAAKLDTLPQENQRQTLSALAAATADSAVADVDDSATKNWLRRRAAVAMATGAKKVDQSAAAAPMLLGLVDDESLSLDSRAAIAASLQGVSLPPNGSAAPIMLKLAAEIGQAEVKEADDFEEIRIGGSLGGGGRGMVSFNKSQRYRFNLLDSGAVEYIREGLAARLANLKAGLKAAEPTAGAKAADVQSAVKAIDAVLAQATSTDTVDLDVTSKVKEMGRAFNQFSTGEEAAGASEEEAVEDLF